MSTDLSLRQTPRFLFAICFLLGTVGARASVENCRGTWNIGTPLGSLRSAVCEAPRNTREAFFTTWRLNGKELLRGSGTLSFESRDEKGRWVLVEDSNDPQLFCPARMFLIDLTGKAPRVFAFGIKNACAEYHWASWGKKRSVIAVKYNIRFTYHNGKLLPPPNDFGDGEPLSRRFPEDGNKPLTPFVEEIPIR